VEGRTIGNVKLGPVMRRLQEQLHAITRGEVSKYSV